MENKVRYVGIEYFIQTMDNSVLVIGAKGAGKTVLLAEISALWAHDVMLIDPLGVFDRGGSPKYAVPDSVVYRDLQTYLSDSDRPQKAIFSFKPSFDDLMTLCQQATPDTIILIDEISLFAEKQAQTDAEFLDFVRTCRNFDITLVLAAQRPQSVDPALSELCVSAVVSRQVGKNTCERAAKLIGCKPIEIMELKRGEWFLTTPQTDVHEREILIPPKYPYVY